MNPSFKAFQEELLLLKLADEEKKPFKSQLPTLLKTRAQSTLKYGLGTGVGAGAGYLFGKTILPKILPKTISPAQEKILGGALGGLSALLGLAKWEALREAGRLEDKAVKDKENVE